MRQNYYYTYVGMPSALMRLDTVRYKKKKPKTVEFFYLAILKLSGISLGSEFQGPGRRVDCIRTAFLAQLAPCYATRDNLIMQFIPRAIATLIKVSP